MTKLSLPSPLNRSRRGGYRWRNRSPVVKKFWFRSLKTPSAPREQESPRMCRCRDATWSSCREPSISEFPDASKAKRNASGSKRSRSLWEPRAADLFCGPHARDAASGRSNGISHFSPVYGKESKKRLKRPPRPRWFIKISILSRGRYGIFSRTTPNRWWSTRPRIIAAWSISSATSCPVSGPRSLLTRARSRFSSSKGSRKKSQKRWIVEFGCVRAATLSSNALKRLRRSTSIRDALSASAIRKRPYSRPISRRPKRSFGNCA